MTLSVEVTEIVDEKEWNRKLLQNRAATLYQTAAWPVIYKEVYGSKPIFICVRDASGEIVGQLASVIHKKLFWIDANIISKIIGNKLNLRSVLNWFYGPIIHDLPHYDEIQTKIIYAIEKIATENKVTMIRGISPPLEKQHLFDSLKDHGYELRPWSTYIIDLHQNTDEYYNSLDKKTRYEIRKSEKNEIEFEIADTRDALTEFQELKIQAKKRARQRTVHDPLFYDKHWEMLYKNGYEKLFLAKHNGEVISGIFALIFNRNVIQHGVANSSKKDLLGGSFLTGNAISWCMKMNYLTFDMAGVNPFPDSEKEKQIDLYKRKWGGKRYDYFLYTKVLDTFKVKFSAALKRPGQLSRRLNKILNVEE